MERRQSMILLTAFLEGLSVLVIEIAGARALAPYYGASLTVWTAQITATLLFLALGYGVGGRMSRTEGGWKLSGVFWAAGLWLALFPFLRTGVLRANAGAGVALGSFLAAVALFGLPLLCLGAVSPLLIARLDARQRGAGSAAGAIFFVNTLGGLGGGWLTALVLIPFVPLRLALAGCGVLLVALGGLWAPRGGRSAAVSAGAVLLTVGLLLRAPRPAAVLQGGRTVVERRQSGAGLIQVVDEGLYARTLYIDGVTQGGMDRQSGLPAYAFLEYLNFLSHRYHPQARSALLLGLGGGLLAKQLVARGVRATAVEIEPRMEAIARARFGLPDAVRVVPEDGRAYLARTRETYDLVFLDTSAGEGTPWYLTTREALAEMKRVLNPGGRLLINSATRARVGSEGLARLEAALLEVFGEALVFVDQAPHGRPTELVTATLVAGEGLAPAAEPFPGVMASPVVPKLPALLAQGRPARAGAPVGTDDFCDLDYVDAPLRLEWRRLVIEALGSEALAD